MYLSNATIKKNFENLKLGLLNDGDGQHEVLFPCNFLSLAQDFEVGKLFSFIYGRFALVPVIYSRSYSFNSIGNETFGLSNYSAAQE